MIDNHEKCTYCTHMKEIVLSEWMQNRKKVFICDLLKHEAIECLRCQKDYFILDKKYSEKMRGGRQ